MLEGEKKELGAELVAAAAALASAESSGTAAKETLSQEKAVLETKVARLSETTQKSAENAAALTQQLSAETTRAEGLMKHVAEAEAKWKQLSQSLEEAAAAADCEKTELQAYSGKLQERLSALETEKSGLEASLAASEKKEESVLTELSAMKTAAESSSGEAGRLGTELGAAREEVEELKTQLATQKAEQTATLELSAKMKTELEASVAALKAQGDSSLAMVCVSKCGSPTYIHCLAKLYDELGLQIQEHLETARKETEEAKMATECVRKERDAASDAATAAEGKLKQSIEKVDAITNQLTTAKEATAAMDEAKKAVEANLIDSQAAYKKVCGNYAQKTQGFKTCFRQTTSLNRFGRSCAQ